MSEIPPYSQPPTSSEFAAYPRELAMGSLANFRALIKANKSINQTVLMVLVVIVPYVGLGVLGSNKSTEVTVFSLLSILVGILALLFFYFYIRTAIFTAKALHSSVTTSVLMSILCILIPCGTLLFLIYCQQKLRKPFETFGVKMGLTGIKKSRIEEIENQLS